LRTAQFEFGLAKLPIVIGHYRSVQPPLQGSPARPAILAFALAASALLCYQAAKVWLADHRIHSTHLETIERGAALEPLNADAWDLLGRHRQLDFANADPQQALADYQRAVQDDPLSATLWMNLAGAYEASGDLVDAQRAFDRARDVYPLSAEVSWNYGNFLLRQDQAAAAYAEMRHAVQSDPRLARLAVSRVWRASRDVNVVLDQVLPTGVDPYIQALDFFASIRQTDAALSVWGRLVSLGQPVPLPRTFPFLDELIQEDRSADAERVWIEALDAARIPRDEPANHSLVCDGRFSRDFDDGGLGWRWQSNAHIGVVITFDGVPASYGVRSARLQFNGGTNLGLSQPAQYIAVEPSHPYHFHAYIRTEDISTESGVRFFISDPNHDRALDLQSENLTGSHPWTSVELDFVTPPTTNFLLLGLLRTPSRLFDNKLNGTVWIADIALTPPPDQGNSSR
jgi:tetratricopeptide (TPR) repeat protein